MKILSYLFIFLLMVMSVSAQIYPVDPSLDSIRTFVFSELNIPTAGTGNVTPTKANLKINLSLGILCSNFPAYEKIDTLVMTSDSDGVILPVDYLRTGSIFRTYNKLLIPMASISHDSMRVLFISDSTVNANDRMKYTSPNYYRIFGRKFFTHPAITTLDTFIVYYYATHPELTTGTDSVIFEPQYFDKFLDLVRLSINSLREQ